MNDMSYAREMMVDCQIRPSDVTKYNIIDAFLSVPREEFVPSSKRAVAYAGEHIDLGEGRFLLDPRVFAKMLDVVNIQPNELVLDLGAGLGYSTAILARIAQTVVGLEENEALAKAAAVSLSEMAIGKGFVEHGPLAEGLAKHGPYDVVFVQGAIETVPAALADQIKDGGRIVTLYSDGNLGQCRIGFKRGSVLSWANEFDATAPVLDGFAKATEFTFA